MADVDSRTGTTYGSREVLDHLAALHVPHDPVLASAFEAPSREGLPAIQVGPSEGKLLGLLTRLARVETAVEVGTLAGYSALHIARALPPSGRLYTIDHDENACRVAREHVERAGLSDRVEIVHADGLDGLARIARHAPFDLVFLDADKGRYDAYGRWAREHLRAGGLLLADNAFFFGRLLDPGDPSAAAMRRFHAELADAFDSVCIPTPDGLALGIRRA